jgi:hypothetical protein
MASFATGVRRPQAAATSTSRKAPASVDSVVRHPGTPLDAGVQTVFGARMGFDFSNVRVHTDADAARSAELLGARAYTLGRHIVMGEERYRPGSVAGDALLAHELTHVVQQAAFHDDRIASPVVADAHDSGESAGVAVAAARPAVQCDRTYTPDEIKAMRAGTVTASADDVAIASRNGFADGDIVFRLGSKVLAALIENPVTHGGIYLGGGLIHDVVGFGNRTTGMKMFYDESADASVVKSVRFIGPHADLIVPRVVGNIKRRDFRLPTDPIPWNLFSSADDFKTATCLEYAHAQFLYAIKQLSADPAVPEATRKDIVSTYFAAGAADPSALATPQKVEAAHKIGDISPVGALMGLADSGGSNIDPSVFQNRFEGTRTTQHFGPPPSSWKNLLVPGFDIQTESFRTFTYKSFKESTRFFAVIR